MFSEPIQWPVRTLAAQWKASIQPPPYNCDAHDACLGPQKPNTHIAIHLYIHLATTHTCSVDSHKYVRRAYGSYCRIKSLNAVQSRGVGRVEQFAGQPRERPGGEACWVRGGLYQRRGSHLGDIGKRPSWCEDILTEQRHSSVPDAVRACKSPLR